MHILVIDDDTFFRKFSAVQLVEKGFTVDVANDGVEGIAKAISIRPDVILLDLIMPKMDGFEALEKLSQNAATKQIPVIIFSTLSQEKDITKAKTLGASDYINKNTFDIETVVSKINSVKKVA